MIPISIAGTKVIGRMCTGNKNGLIVPASITEEEENVLKTSLPSSVTLAKVDDKLSALGNVIVANDRVALLHPDLDAETEATIQSVLNVEAFKTTIASNALVGTYCCLSN